MPNGESLLPYRPHIIYNLADDWAWPTWPDVGGLPRAMLPNVADLFVDGALTLDQHYAARACAPSRRSLLSGRFVHAIGSHKATVLASDPATNQTLFDIEPFELVNVHGSLDHTAG